MAIINLFFCKVLFAGNITSNYCSYVFNTFSIRINVVVCYNKIEENMIGYYVLAKTSEQ